MDKPKYLLVQYSQIKLGIEHELFAKWLNEFDGDYELVSVPDIGGSQMMTVWKLREGRDQLPSGILRKEAQ